MGTPPLRLPLAADGPVHPNPVRSGSPPPGLDIPTGLCCPRCRYPCGESGSAICPECGWAATRAYLDWLGERRRQLDAWGGFTGGRWRRAGVRRAVLGWLATIGLASGLATAVAPSLEVFIFTLLGLLAFVGCGWVLAWPVGRLERSAQRPYARMDWSRALWRLHLPWLWSPAYLVIALGLGLVERAAGDVGGWLYWTCAPVVLTLWVMGVMWAWKDWRSRTSHSPGVVASGPPARAFGPVGRVLGACNMLVATALGLAVWAIVLFRVAGWLGVGPGPWKLLEVFAVGSL